MNSIAKNKDRDWSLYFLKGLAIIGVVFWHTENRLMLTTVDDFIALVKGIFPWCVLLFFAISGWLHNLSEERHLRSLPEFIIIRTKRLLIPWIGLVTSYAILLQVLQGFHLVNKAGERLPVGFLDKLIHSIPFIDYHPISVQLYFFLFLFVISIALHTAFKLLREKGAWGLMIASLLAGIWLTPHGLNTGARLSVIFFGTFAYSAGFLMHYYREFKYRIIGTLVLSAICVLALGVEGLPKIVPLLMLESMYVLRLGKCTLLAKIGEASGTIYAYHILFVLIPFLILAAHLPESLQVPGVILAGAATIATCTIGYFILKKTRLKWVLI